MKPPKQDVDNNGCITIIIVIFLFIAFLTFVSK